MKKNVALVSLRRFDVWHFKQKRTIAEKQQRALLSRKSAVLMSRFPEENIYLQLFFLFRKQNEFIVVAEAAANQLVLPPAVKKRQRLLVQKNSRVGGLEGSTVTEDRMDTAAACTAHI